MPTDDPGASTAPAEEAPPAADAPPGDGAATTTVGRARRLLKDSGRFLLAGVKAALSGPPTAADVLLAWQAGRRQAAPGPCDLGAAVKAAMARRTSTCAERGVDLLLDADAPMLPVVADPALLDAAVDVALEAAMTAFERGRAVHVRLERDHAGRASAALAGSAHDASLDGLVALLAHDALLGLVRAALVAQGGDLWLERGPELTTLRLALPAAADAPRPLGA